MDEMNLADLVREISRSVQQTVSNNSKTFVEIRRTVDSTVKEIKDTVLETVDTVKNTAARPKTPPKPAPYQPQWVDGKLMKRSAPGKITGLLLALLGAVPGVPIVAALVVSAILLAVKGLNLSAAVAFLSEVLLAAAFCLVAACVCAGERFALKPIARSCGA